MKVIANCINYLGENDYAQGTNFIKQQFLDTSNFSQKIYHHYTCAISTENVKFVFQSVKETLLQDTLNDFML